MKWFSKLIEALKPDSVPKQSQPGGRKITRKPSAEAVYCPLCENRMKGLGLQYEIYQCIPCDIAYSPVFGAYTVSNPDTIEKCKKAGYNIVKKVIFEPPPLTIIDCL